MFDFSGKGVLRDHNRGRQGKILNPAAVHAEEMTMRSDLSVVACARNVIKTADNPPRREFAGDRGCVRGAAGKAAVVLHEYHHAAVAQRDAGRVRDGRPGD